MMNLFCLTKNLIVTIVFLAILSPAHATTKVSGSDKNLQYTGRIDFSNVYAPSLSWPGSSVAGNFTGQYLSVTLVDQFGGNYFNVFIDHDLNHPIMLKAETGEKTYLIADNLAPGKHSFLLTKRTEGEDGATAIKEFILADGAELLPPSVRLKRKIEFFGDSITSGMGNESPDGAPDNLAKDKNNFMAYSAITARNLNAEMHITSQSGIGVMVSWFPFIMPQFYDQLNAYGRNDTKWDFSSWTPDVVVINLFQNDRWLIEIEHRLNPEPSDEQRIQAYVDFVKTIRGKYRDAYIVCALGSMDATQEGSKWPGYITAAVTRIKNGNNKEKIDTIFFPYTGYDAHPRVKQHQTNAALLSTLIKQKMKW